MAESVKLRAVVSVVADNPPNDWYHLRVNDAYKGEFTKLRDALAALADNVELAGNVPYGKRVEVSVRIQYGN